MCNYGTAALLSNRRTRFYQVPDIVLILYSKAVSIAIVFYSICQGDGSTRSTPLSFDRLNEARVLSDSHEVHSSQTLHVVVGISHPFVLSAVETACEYPVHSICSDPSILRLPVSHYSGGLRQSACVFGGTNSMVSQRESTSIHNMGESTISLPPAIGIRRHSAASPEANWQSFCVYLLQ